jgi:hypothetical protein
MVCQLGTPPASPYSAITQIKRHALQSAHIYLNIFWNNSKSIFSFFYCPQTDSKGRALQKLGRNCLKQKRTYKICGIENLEGAWLPPQFQRQTKVKSPAAKLTGYEISL